MLARILSDRGLVDTRWGAVNLAMAGVGDVTAWCPLGGMAAQVRNDSPLNAGLSLGVIGSRCSQCRW
ncbi:hypothetical protein OG900_32110 [Streptomyces sp. NBC_00433]